MTMQRRQAIKTGAALSATLAAPWVHAQKADKVRLSWLPIMQTTALYVAVQDRLFERAGIDAELVQFQNPNQIIDSLVANQADAGAPGAAAGITMLAESRYPGSFKVFGLQGGGIRVNRINDGLIVKNGSPIKTFKDLRGRSLGHLPGIQWRTISRHMLRVNGLDPDKDVRLQEIAVGLQVPSVVAGSIDATLSLEPVGSVAVASGEATRAIVNPCASVIADPFYSGVSVLTARFIKERPQVARKLVQVLDQATRIANAEFNRVRPYFAKYTAIRGEQVRVIAQPYLRAWSELDDTDVRSYQALVDVFHKEGVLKDRMDVRTVLLKPSDLA
ncbi:MAG TPA: ABC transporter substrate-binding protein [Burkholderiaceae bacterium]|nr:ABC transporter substrate-binding protein [Burkholderiaceae bacterium]